MKLPKALQYVLPDAIAMRLKLMKREKKTKDVSYISSPDGQFKITIEQME